ncbi:hypothetical protein AB1Y20_020030 [Prymnesium parvum]|uniref:Uncharacterized protein n=1 Tax=Prymnesium parvum TaxID=97485 RepID=A0AB34JXK6_PRYPA
MAPSSADEQPAGRMRHGATLAAVVALLLVEAGFGAVAYALSYGGARLGRAESLLKEQSEQLEHLERRVSRLSDGLRAANRSIRHSMMEATPRRHGPDAEEEGMRHALGDVGPSSDNTTSGMVPKESGPGDEQSDDDDDDDDDDEKGKKKGSNRRKRSGKNRKANKSRHKRSQG